MSSKKTSIRNRIGIVFIITGFVSPLIGLIVPFLNLSSTLTSSLVALLMVGGPEVFLVIGTALAGKKGITMVQNRIKRLLGLPEGRYPATKSQYNLALVIMFIWLISLTVPLYIPGFIEQFHLDQLMWYYYLIIDVLFIVAFVFLGGHQFTTKFLNLITWEEWQLPDKNKD
ncbi:transporter suffix domain-containing protein [Flammeovirga sp. EKP202]|uniref:transporter suffix domain-containing protein n=1 Tax=Flammeovirga sp. EKP202 TaxID=2770592 RepID=UPI00165FFE45|nr:transporter suffix domain-containing protein [Flammeovirga sp. EKP202]MBD0400749.1 transporter suffix domain-containing protein [Flammeovirga sp. EKP202]